MSERNLNEYFAHVDYSSPSPSIYQIIISDKMLVGVDISAFHLVNANSMLYIFINDSIPLLKVQLNSPIHIKEYHLGLIDDTLTLKIVKYNMKEKVSKLILKQSFLYFKKKVLNSRYRKYVFQNSILFYINSLKRKGLKGLQLHFLQSIKNTFENRVIFYKKEFFSLIKYNHMKYFDKFKQIEENNKQKFYSLFINKIKKHNNDLKLLRILYIMKNKVVPNIRRKKLQKSIDIILQYSKKYWLNKLINALIIKKKKSICFIKNKLLVFNQFKKNVLCLTEEKKSMQRKQSLFNKKRSYRQFMYAVLLNHKNNSIQKNAMRILNQKLYLLFFSHISEKLAQSIHFKVLQEKWKKTSISCQRYKFFSRIAKLKKQKRPDISQTLTLYNYNQRKDTYSLFFNRLRHYNQSLKSLRLIYVINNKVIPYIKTQKIQNALVILLTYKKKVWSHILLRKLRFIKQISIFHQGTVKRLFNNFTTKIKLVKHQAKQYKNQIVTFNRKHIIQKLIMLALQRIKVNMIEHKCNKVLFHRGTHLFFNYISKEVARRKKRLASIYELKHFQLSIALKSFIKQLFPINNQRTKSKGTDNIKHFIAKRQLLQDVSEKLQLLRKKNIYYDFLNQIKKCQGRTIIKEKNNNSLMHFNYWLLFNRIKQNHLSIKSLRIKYYLQHRLVKIVSVHKMIKAITILVELNRQIWSMILLHILIRNKQSILFLQKRRKIYYKDFIKKSLLSQRSKDNLRKIGIKLNQKYILKHLLMIVLQTIKKDIITSNSKKFFIRRLLYNVHKQKKAKQEKEHISDKKIKTLIKDKEQMLRKIKSQKYFSYFVKKIKFVSKLNKHLKQSLFAILKNHTAVAKEINVYLKEAQYGN